MQTSIQSCVYIGFLSEEAAYPHNDCEMTIFSLDHRKEKIHKFGHMHLDVFLDRKDQFKNDLVIASYLSTRYHPSTVKQMVEKALPGMLDGRLKLWL